MGCCLTRTSSTSQEDTRNGTIDDSNSLEVAKRTSLSICRVFSNDDQLLALGVAVVFSAHGTSVYGIVSHCFNVPPHCVIRRQSTSIAVTEAVCFTCPIIEVTFIQLKQELVDVLIQDSCSFIDLEQQTQSIGKEEVVLLVDSFPETRFASGHSIEYYGLDLRYAMSCSFLSPGLPIVSASGHLLALHKASTNKHQEYLAVSARSITTALIDLYNFSSPQASIVSSPHNLSSYETNLKEQGLEAMPDRSDYSRYKSCNLYMSPPEQYITPIWFAPTYLGWYWSPTDPDGDAHPNWMPVNRLEVIGGEWNGQIPAPKNTKIIRWLNQKNITCGTLD